MSDNDTDVKIVPETLGEQTLSITLEQLKDYYAKHGSDGACEVCGARDWDHPEERGMPSIMSVLTPRSPNSASWFFWMVCTKCTNTRMIAAGYVWAHYFRSGSQ